MNLTWSRRRSFFGIYDRFASLKAPIRITEFDIHTGDEKVQADYLRDFLTASSSHSNIKGIMIWGFWETAHWRPNAAMFRKDWSPRPIANVWKDLIFNEWWTNERISSSNAGIVKLRAFLGDYTLTATCGSRTTTTKATLVDGGTSMKIVLAD